MRKTWQEQESEKLVELRPWAVHVFPWGTAVKKRNGDWTKVILNGGQEIDVSDFKVILHNNGIEFSS